MVLEKVHSDIIETEGGTVGDDAPHRIGNVIHTGAVNNCVPRLSSYPPPLANNTVDPMSGIALEPERSNVELFLEGVQDRVRNRSEHNCEDEEFGRGKRVVQLRIGRTG